MVMVISMKVVTKAHLHLQAVTVKESLQEPSDSQVHSSSHGTQEPARRTKRVTSRKRNFRVLYKNYKESMLERPDQFSIMWSYSDPDFTLHTGLVVKRYGD